MFSELMLVTGYVFWIGLAALILLNVILLYQDDEGPTGFGVAITSAAFLFVLLFTDAFKGLAWWALIAMVFVYIGVGVSWAFKKWYSYLIERRNELMSFWNRASEPKTPWADFVRNQIPTAANNKTMIVGWMVLWPWSMSWWILTWPRRLFNWIYERVSTAFDRMAQRIFE